jgi:hypothetical protein
MNIQWWKTWLHNSNWYAYLSDYYKTTGEDDALDMFEVVKFQV